MRAVSGSDQTDQAVSSAAAAAADPIAEREAAANRFRAIAEQSFEMLMIVDDAQILRWANAAFERLLGYRPESLIGKTLGMTVIAEGVEDQVQLDFLRRLGCDAAQGFFLARPQPAAEISTFLASRPAGEGSRVSLRPGSTAPWSNLTSNAPQQAPEPA